MGEFPLNGATGRLSAALALTLALGGCAAGQKRDCLSGDWEGLGYRDGRAGLGFERIGALAERCGDYDVTVDSAAWVSGHERGIGEYCEPSRGFDLGVAAGDYTGSCPPALERRYLGSYVRGLGIHRDELQLDYDRLRRDLDTAQRERAALLDDEEPDEEDIEGAGESIESLEERLRANLDQRRDVNARLARWSRGL